MNLIFWENWTFGQMLFYGGAALMGLAVILIIIFAIIKPKYKPETVAFDSADGSTVPLRNSYPTERQTIRRESKATVIDGSGTEKLEVGTSLSTDLLPNVALAGTEILLDEPSSGDRATELLTDELSSADAAATELLTDVAVDETEMLEDARK